jgi:hypothetical protein
LPLDLFITQMPDFIAVLGNVTEGDVIQCAEVTHTEFRKWVRLIGLRHDVQVWAPDPRLAKSQSHSRQLQHLKSNEKWVQDILNPWVQIILPGMKLFASSEHLSDANYAVLRGYFSESDAHASLEPSESTSQMISSALSSFLGAGTEKAALALAAAFEAGVTLKEVVVYRYPRVVQVFNVISHGRRFYSQLVFSSSAQLCLCDMPPEGVVVSGQQLMCCGNPRSCERPVTTAVITRNISKEVGVQTFIPERLIRGLLPTCITRSYDFWQNSNDTFWGYPNKTTVNTNICSTVIEIKLAKTRCVVLSSHTVNAYYPAAVKMMSVAGAIQLQMQ